MFGFLRQTDVEPLLAAVRDELARARTLAMVPVRHTVEATVEGIVERLERHRTETEARFDAIHARIIQLTGAIDEGIARTDRAERRIKSAVRRARAQLADSGLDDDGLDAEAHGYGVTDGERGGSGGVPPLSARVDAREETSSVRGVPLTLLQKARGLR